MYDTPGSKGEKTMGRDENAEVFKDTEKLCKTNQKISKSVKKGNSGTEAYSGR